MGALRLPVIPGIEDFNVFPVREIRVCRHIAHMVGAGGDARQHSQQIRYLIGAGVIGAHQRVGRVEGTVQKPGAGVLRRHFQAGGVHPGAGGKHDVGIVMGHIFQQLLRIHLRVDVFPAADTHPARERLEQRVPALILAPHPGTGLGVVLVQEHHPQLTGPRAENIQLAEQRFRALLGGGLQLQLHRLRPGQDLDLIPELGEVLPHLGRGGFNGVGVAVNRQVHQQRIAGRQPKGRAAQCIELLAEHGVKGSEIQPVVVCPALARSLADQRLQFGIAAQPGEMDIVDLGELVKIQELIVDLIFQRLVPLRHQPGHGAGDLDRLIVLEHRDPLVALFHIEFVQVFVGRNGIPDAFFQMGVAEVGPLAGKLAVGFQDRHEIGGKGRVAARRFGAHNALGRDVHQPQRLLCHNVDTS